MGEIVKISNEKNNEILAMMNDTLLCPAMEESKVGIANYTQVPISRLASIGTTFEPLAAAVQTAVNGAGGSGLY